MIAIDLARKSHCRLKWHFNVLYSDFFLASKRTFGGHLFEYNHPLKMTVLFYAVKQNSV